MKRMRWTVGLVCLLSLFVGLLGAVVPDVSEAVPSSRAAGTWRIAGAVTSFTSSTGQFLGEVIVGADGSVTGGRITLNDTLTRDLSGGNITVFPDQTVSGTISAAPGCNLEIMGQIGNASDVMVLTYHEYCGSQDPSAGGTIVAIKKNESIVFDPAADMGGNWRFAMVGVGGNAYGYVKGTLKLGADGSLLTGSGGTADDGSTFTLSGGRLLVDGTGLFQGNNIIKSGSSQIASFEGAVHSGKKLMGGVVTMQSASVGYALFVAVQAPATATQADLAGSWGWAVVHSEAQNIGWVLGRFPLDGAGLMGWNFGIADTHESFGFVPGGKLTVGATGGVTGTLSFVGGGTLTLDTLLDASKELFLGTFKATQGGGTSPGFILGLRRDAPEPQACQPLPTVLPVDTPTGGTLAAGDCRSRVNNTVFADTYSFSGTAGDVVTLDLTADFWPQIVLFGPGGAALAAVDTESAGPLQLTNFVLPETSPDGKPYIVEVSGLLPAATGSYTLTRSAGASCPDATPFTPGASFGAAYSKSDALAPGDCAGPFTRNAYADRYTFSGSAGSILTFELAPQSGTFEPGLLLFNESGEIASVSFGNQSETVRIERYRLPAAGTYSLVVSSDGPGQTGNYTLKSWFDTAASCTPAPFTLTFGAPILKSLVPSTACMGTFITAGPSHRYTFTGTAGDLLDVDLQLGMTPATLVLDLLNADGGLVARHEDYVEFPGGQLRHIVLPATGSYALEVTGTRFGTDLEPTGAPYRLLAKKIAALGAPSITSFTPTTGGAAGVSMTVTGTNFGTVEGTVTFPGGGAAVIGTWANTSVTVTVPVGTGDGTLTLTTADGKAATKAFTLPDPTLTSLSPISGGVGTTVTVTGTNFGAAEGAVTFVDAMLNPLSAVIQQGTWTNTTVKVTVPAGAETGDLTLTRADGVTAAKTFTVPGPTITSLTPAIGAVGMTVTIVGANFGATTGTVTFTGSAGPATLVGAWSNTGMKVLVPNDATTGNLTVMTADNRPARKLFTVPAPTITSLALPSGTVGQTVTITGTNLGVTAGTVRFFGSNTDAALAPSTTWSNTTVKVVVPADATTGNLSLTRADQVSVAADKTKLFTVPAPTVTTLAPLAGAVGTRVTLTGTNLGAVQGTGGVTFARTGGGTVAAGIVSWAVGSVTVTIPVGATNGNVILTRGDGIAAPGKPFTIPNPTITSLAAVTGAGGTTVTVTGKDFGTAQGTVTFVDAALNPLPAAIVGPWTNTSVKVTVPAGAETGNLTLSTADVPARTATKPFTVPGGPTFTLTPASAAVGVQVTIAGSNLGATAGTVTFTGASGPVPAALALNTTWTATSVKVLVPADAITGDLTLTTAAGRVTRKPFTVPAPTVTTLAPLAGAVGTRVTLTGTNLGAVQGTGNVTFARTGGGTVAAGIVSWANGSVTVTIPANATTGNVVLTRGDGVAAPGKLFTIPNPTITSLAPISGAANATVTITGNHFGTAQGTVTFVDAALTPLPAVIQASTWTNTSVKVTVPAGAETGNLTLSTADVPARTATKPFTVPGGPTFTLTPASAAVGVQVVIAGSNLGATAGTVTFTGASGPVPAALALNTTWTAASVKVLVPADAITGDLTLTTAAGRVTRKAFSVPAPTVNTLTPASGKVGAAVILTGTNLGATAGSVTFGGVPATLYPGAVWGNGSVKVTVPAGVALGSVSVELTRADTVAAAPKTFTVLP